MIHRAWTLVIGFMAVYLWFTTSYDTLSQRVKNYFPMKRDVYLSIGYMLFLSGLSEGTSWCLRKFAAILKPLTLRRRRADILMHPRWLLFEIVAWAAVGYGSIYLWVRIGESYGSPPKTKKMFMLALTFAILSKGTRYFTEDYEGEEEDDD